MAISMKAAFLLLSSLALVATPARGDGSFFDSLAKSTGLIAPTPDPPDFVKDSRPKAEPTSIPVFAAPAEPSSKVKTPAELKAMDADLERAGRSHDALRGAGDAKSKKRSDRPKTAPE